MTNKNSCSREASGDYHNCRDNGGRKRECLPRAVKKYGKCRTLDALG